MPDALIEVEFENQFSWRDDTPNVLTKEQLDKLQTICTRKISFTQLSKRHQDKNELSFWQDEDLEHEDIKNLLDAYFIGGHKNIVSLNQLLNLNLPIEFKIKDKIKEVPEYNIEQNILHKLLKLESKLDIFDNAAQFNAKVGVHISDLGLLNIREVTWLEDSCTEVLQDYLDAGWRILAVCPQPNSRRPDYILGRNDNESK